jgi:hypothetical protein
MIDPGWDLWDLNRVRTTLWPSTADWADIDELWPEVAIAPPEERRSDPPPIRLSDVTPLPGPLWITYWAWAVGTPFVKIGRTQYQADRDGRWRGKAELAERRIREWSTGCMYSVRLLRVHLDDAGHEGVEQALRAAARVTPEREWFDLRRL